MNNIVSQERLRRFREEGHRFYRPTSKQLEVHMEDPIVEVRCLRGGNQSGKSFSGVNEILWIVAKTHPFRPNLVGPVDGRDCCVSLKTLRTVLIPTYKKLVPREECVLEGWEDRDTGEIIGDLTYEGKERYWPGLLGGSWESAYSKEDEILWLADGSSIEFNTYNQDTDVYAGPKKHVIRFDEEPPEAIYEECTARFATTKRNIFFTITPLNYSQWINSRVFERSSKDGRYKVYDMDTADNPLVTPEALAAMEETYSDPAIKAARLHGKPTYLHGLVWKEYGDHNFIDPFIIPASWPITTVIDPHPDKPTAFNLYADDPHRKRSYCIAEGDFYGGSESVIAQIKNACGPYRISKWICDPAAKGQKNTWGSDGESLFDTFQQAFPELQEANNDRVAGWDRVRNWVKNTISGPRFYVFKTCPITNHQMRNYSWKPPTRTGENRSKPEVYKKQDDHCDNNRYYMMSEPETEENNFIGFGNSVYGNV